jgi:uncharacterized protein YaaR (DUF327 family)
MKIDRDKKELSLGALPRPTTRGVERAQSSSFDQELAQRREAECQLKMQELLRELDRLGESLKRSLTIQDLVLYRKLVKQFLKEATSRAYSLKQEQSRSRRGRTLLITIQTVDQEVEALVDDFIRKKKEPVEVLTALDKIRGMLVDLMA